MASNYYGGVIWTNHVLERVNSRGISADMVLATFNNPQRSKPGKEGSTLYIKQFGEQTVTIVTKRNEKGEWLLLSAWMEPPLPGTIDAKRREKYRTYKNASGWKKFLLTLTRQLGF